MASVLLTNGSTVLKLKLDTAKKTLPLRVSNRSLEPKLFIVCKSMIKFSLLRFDNSVQFLNNSPIKIVLKFVLWISILTATRTCSFCLSWRILILPIRFRDLIFVCPN